MATFDAQRMAKIVLRSTRHLPVRHEYREVDGAEYPHVSQRFYRQTTDALRAVGFRTLGDMEDGAVKATAVCDPRTFTRVMVDATGTTVAEFYHVAPTLKWRLVMLALRFPTKYLDFSSLGENGTTYGTTNSPEKAVLPKPEWATRQHVPRNANPAEMYAQHQQLLKGVVTPLHSFRNLPDVIRVQTEVRARQRAHLEQIGWVTKDYLRVHGIPESQIEAVYDEVQRLVGEGFTVAS